MLLGIGLKRGDRVAILCNNTNEFLEVAMGCARVGIAWVPLNSRFVESEIEYVVNNSGAKAIVMGQRFAEKVGRIIQNFISVRENTCVVIGDQVPKGMIGYQEAVGSSSETDPPVKAEETDILYLGYTSGTTGFPKGALISQRNRVIASLFWALEYGLSADGITLHAAPLYHSAPMTFSLLHFYMGGTVCLMPDFQEEEVLKLIEKEEITNVFLVPTMLNRILNLPEQVREKYNTRSLRVIICNASPLPTKTKEDAMAFFKDSRLHEFYGATETGILTSIKHWKYPEKKQSVGLPIFETEVCILDDEGNNIPVGQVGEIYFRSPTRFNGYHGMPEATAEVFRGEWQTLNDLGKLDEEGFLYIVGRKKDMIKSGGVNIYPKEIEDVLHTHPKVMDVAVIGIPDEHWGESVKAIIILKEGQIATGDEIIQFCQGKLASFKIPQTVDFAEEFPRTPIGKILKRKLRAPFWKDKAVKV
jgi:acyl-CoA synthetase (AMP-forming)/AMP-acid ligase II